MNGIEIEQVHSIKYLGFDISDSGNFYCLKNSINDLKVRANAIVNNFACLDTDSKIKLFNSQCLSLYGSCLWDLRSKQVNGMEVAWRKSSRRILNIDRRSHNVLIPHLMCTHDLRIMIEQRIFNFYANCLNHKNKLISNIF